jgi:Domain of unknown function (DUF1707)
MAHAMIASWPAAMIARWPAAMIARWPAAMIASILGKWLLFDLLAPVLRTARRQSAWSTDLGANGILIGMAEGAEDLRAGDADRQAVAERLRIALDEGRLAFHEYDTRLQEAYQARTYGELNRLVADLPASASVERSAVVPPVVPSVVPAAPVTPAVAYPNATRRWLVALWDDYFGAVSICVAVWLAIGLTSEDWQGFWPIWVAGPWGAYLVYETTKGLATGEPQRWAVRQDRKRTAKDLKRQRKREIGAAEESDAAEA